jgi:hypothetical protein
MLAHAERLASSFKELGLYTSKLCSANIALYTRLGYRINREKPFKGNFVVYMGKRIEERRWSGSLILRRFVSLGRFNPA